MPNYNVGWQVTKYELNLPTGSAGAVKAVLGLTSAQGHDAYVVFFASGPVQANALDHNGNLRMNATYDHFHPLMEMLREEKPIWVGGLLYGWNSISTSQEPVGEEEGVFD